MSSQQIKLNQKCKPEHRGSGPVKRVQLSEFTDLTDIAQI